MRTRRRILTERAACRQFTPYFAHTLVIGPSHVP